MGVTLPAFTPLEDGLFLTVYAPALDNRRPHAILGDAEADQLVDKLDYEVHLVHLRQPAAQRLPGRSRCPRQDSNLRPTA
jgi:O-methyltransferase involved in polyketide biosynthesis